MATASEREHKDLRTTLANYPAAEEVNKSFDGETKRPDGG